MNRIIAGIILGVLILSSVAQAKIWVNGYVGKDGGYTSGHYRSTTSERYNAAGEWKGW